LEKIPKYIEVFLKELKYKYENNADKMKKIVDKINEDNWVSNKLNKRSEICLHKLITKL
jgi:hypothetical protein